MNSEYRENGFSFTQAPPTVHPFPTVPKSTDTRPAPMPEAPAGFRRISLGRSSVVPLGYSRPVPPQSPVIAAFFKSRIA